MPHAPCILLRVLSRAFFCCALFASSACPVDNCVPWFGSYLLLNDHRYTRCALLSATADITMMLVGNKTDLAQGRVVSTEEGKSYSERNGVSFMEASALTASNVEASFLKVCNNNRDEHVTRHVPCIVALNVIGSNARTRYSSPHPHPHPKLNITLQILSEIYHKKAKKEQEAAGSGNGGGGGGNTLKVTVKKDGNKKGCC